MVHTASGLLRTGLPALLLALVAGLPTELRAQYSTRAAADMPHVSPGPPVGPIAFLGVVADTVPADSARHSVVPFLVGGALAGALIGGVLAASFNDSYCGDPAPGVTCSSTSTAAGVAIGAGVGLLAGWLLWTLSTPAEPPPRAGSR